MDQAPKKRSVIAQQDSRNQQGSPSYAPVKFDDKLKFMEIEKQIKQFVQNLKSLQVENELPEGEKLNTQQTLDKIGRGFAQEYSDVKPIKRKLQLNEILNPEYFDKIVLKEKSIARNQNEKEVQLKELLAKDKPIQMFVKEVGDFIFIVLYQDVAFTLFGIQKDELYQNEGQIDLNFLSHVKMQFQVIYQEQSHSEKITCCEQTFYYPSAQDESSNNQPSLCFLMGGDIGEIFIIKDSVNSFTISRRQVCTGQIQQIVVPEENNYFMHQNICLVLSQLEHIYLFNFVNGIIIAQFGNQGSSGPGKYLRVSWHPSYEYFLSSRENGGIELWKVDQTIIHHIQEAYSTNKPPGKFFRKYVDMAYYYTLGVHVHQTGALLFSTLLEHILVTIDNNFVLRYTALEIKNSESHLNILTVDLKLHPSDIVNIFSHRLDVFIVTRSRILVFSLNENSNLFVDLRQISYDPQNFNHIFITQDYKYIIGLKDQQIYLTYQQGFSNGESSEMMNEIKKQLLIEA